jgi:voltage-gated potassium channel Kch
VFFIAVGASIDFGLIARQPGFIALLVSALVVTKWLVLLVLGRVFKMGLDQNLLFAFSLAQGGEFAFVLFSFSVQNGVVSAAVADPLIVVVAISMAITPLLLLINEKIIQPRAGTRRLPDREPDTIDEENPVIIAGFGSFGSIVERMLASNGVKTTVLEYDSDRVELLRKLGLKAYYGDASRHDLLHIAGAGKAKLLVLALDDHDKIVEMVRLSKKHFPNLTILARASGRNEAYELLDEGVEHVYRETLDTSLRMAVDALRALGQRAYHARRAAKTFRRHDEESVHELARMRHDRKAYISTARQRIQDLEQLLLSELSDEGESRDAGWDTESLRGEFGRKQTD